MRKRWIAVVIVVVGIWWLRRDEPESRWVPPQAAVLSDGFALFADDHVVEYDREGNNQHEMTLRKHREDVRFVGTRTGAAIGWQDGKKLKLAILDSDGNTEDDSTWGKHVKQLCVGAATNEHRFGIGWLESDGNVWFVHGPMTRMAGEVVDGVEAPTTKAWWCGIASAEQNVALLWREGSRLLMNFCTKKECTSLVVKVPIDSKDNLLAFGCVRDACLFATRDKHGTTKLHRVTEKGRTIVKALEHARPDSRISIVGAGTRAFAIAYVSTDGNATIQRVAVDGALTNVWHFNAEITPSLAWAGDKLFVAMPSRDAWVLAMPR